MKLAHLEEVGSEKGEQAGYEATSPGGSER
jgi:hypothetical protein